MIPARCPAASWIDETVELECQLEANHDGPHTSVWERGTGRYDRFTNFVVTWENNPGYEPPPPADVEWEDRLLTRFHVPSPFLSRPSHLRLPPPEAGRPITFRQLAPPLTAEEAPVISSSNAPMPPSAGGKPPRATPRKAARIANPATVALRTAAPKAQFRPTLPKKK